MARRYINTAKSATLVTDVALVKAQERKKAAAERLREAEQADPRTPGWDLEYDASVTAHRAAERRVEALERLRAAQIERGGKRDEAVKAAAGDLTAIASALAASRDQVAAAAAAHLAALAKLGTAVDTHNRLLAEGRARIAAAGLAVRDDLVDEGQEHAEGTMDRAGLRAGGVDWLPIPAGGLEAHALRAVFGEHHPSHPLAQVGKYQFRPHEVQARADGLRVPVLKSGEAPAAPARMVMPDRPSIRDNMAPPVVGMSHPDWRPSMMSSREGGRS